MPAVVGYGFEDTGDYIERVDVARARVRGCKRRECVAIIANARVNLRSCKS